MKSDIKVEVSGTEELVIREGAALPLKEPVIASLSGVLDSPLKWLEKRIDGLDQKACNIIVDRENLKIRLTVNETSAYGNTVSGKLEFHPLFKLFAVNANKYLSNFEMANLIKMNRFAFETQAVAMNLVSELQNFRAKVEKEVEKLNDNRGNKRDLLAQTVDCNLPDSFILVMPIFKGTPKQSFEVEVYIKPDDFSCTLISPTANDLIEEMRNEQIDIVLGDIRDLAPDIVIIEQ